MDLTGRTTATATTIATAYSLAASLPSESVLPFRMDDGSGADALKAKYPVDMTFEVLRPATGKTVRINTAATKASETSIKTLSASNNKDYTVVALIENRARDVGVAVCNLSAMHTIELIQLHDNQTYTQTIALLQLLNPIEIVMSKSQSERVLFQKIVSMWGSGTTTQIAAISRKFFDDARGMSLLHSLGSRPPTGDHAPQYLALSSLAALTKYIENMQHIVFADKSIHFSFKEPQGRMALDFETVKSLELLVNSRTGGEKDSLFNVINNTATPMGARLLRAQLLSPLSDENTINIRLDCVEAFLNNPKKMELIRNSLPKSIDLDLILSQCVAKPRVTSPRTARVALSVLLNLKHTLELCPRLAEVLESFDSPLLSAIRANVSHTIFSDVLTSIGTMIAEEAKWSKSAAVMRHQECFAILPNVDGNLDAVRKVQVYTDTLTELNNLLERYREEWAIRSLKLHYTAARGYHVVANIDENLPPSILQPVTTKASVAFTTDALASLNDRMKESTFNIYVMTNILLQDMLAQLRQRMPAFLKLNESLALLDLLCSMATFVFKQSKAAPYVRPVLLESGPTVIVAGRHPLAERFIEGFVANDVFMGPGNNVLVLMGPNCSGKSIMLKQVGLLTILAHIGCFVPAEFATLRITDRICTRDSTRDYIVMLQIGTSDDMEANASTFLREMKEAAFVMECVADPASRCLVLVDELGRGTSNEDGLGLAWAVCERLACSDAHCLFVTHFHELAELATIYSPIRTANMGVAVHVRENTISYSYKLTDGAHQSDASYGIELAEVCGLPRRMIASAREIKAKLQARIVPRSVVLESTVELSPTSFPVTPTRSSSVGTGRFAADLSHPGEAAKYAASMRLLTDVASKLAPILGEHVPDEHKRKIVQDIKMEYSDQLSAVLNTGSTISRSSGSGRSTLTKTAESTMESATKMSNPRDNALLDTNSPTVSLLRRYNSVTAEGDINPKAIHFDAEERGVGVAAESHTINSIPSLVVADVQVNVCEQTHPTSTPGSQRPASTEVPAHSLDTDIAANGVNDDIVDVNELHGVQQTTVFKEPLDDDDNTAPVEAAEVTAPEAPTTAAGVSPPAASEAPAPLAGISSPLALAVLGDGSRSVFVDAALFEAFF